MSPPILKTLQISVHKKNVLWNESLTKSWDLSLWCGWSCGLWSSAGGWRGGLVGVSAATKHQSKSWRQVGCVTLLRSQFRAWKLKRLHCPKSTSLKPLHVSICTIHNIFCVNFIANRQLHNLSISRPDMTSHDFPFPWIFVKKVFLQMLLILIVLLSFYTLCLLQFYHNINSNKNKKNLSENYQKG